MKFLLIYFPMKHFHLASRELNFWVGADESPTVRSLSAIKMITSLPPFFLGSHSPSSVIVDTTTSDHDHIDVDTSNSLLIRKNTYLSFILILSLHLNNIPMHLAINKYLMIIYNYNSIPKCFYSIHRFQEFAAPS